MPPWPAGRDTRAAKPPSRFLESDSNRDGNHAGPLNRRTGRRDSGLTLAMQSRVIALSREVEAVQAPSCDAINVRGTRRALHAADPARGSERQRVGNHLLAGWVEERTDADEQRWAAMNSDGPEHDAVSQRIIGCAFTVANTLGNGFPEKAYENALALELRGAGFAVAQQRPIGVGYKGVPVGAYFADLLVEGAILVEL